MCLIALTASAAMLLAYRGVFSAISGAYIPGTIELFGAVPLGVACWFLCKHRTDLVCD